LVGAGFNERFKRTCPAQGFLYFRGRLGGGSGSGGTLEWVESGNGALPKMEAWMGPWNGTVHRFTSNWRELRTVVETLKREDVVFNKLRWRIFFYFTDNEVFCHICKKGSSKTLYMHMLVQQLKALELALGCHLEVIMSQEPP
jgi:hypothetical protein